MSDQKRIYKADIVTGHSVGVARLLAALGLDTTSGPGIERVVLDLKTENFMTMTVTKYVDEDQLAALTKELEENHPQNRQLLGVSRGLTSAWSPRDE